MRPCFQRNSVAVLDLVGKLVYKILHAPSDDYIGSCRMEERKR